MPFLACLLVLLVLFAPLVVTAGPNHHSASTSVSDYDDGSDDWDWHRYIPDFIVGGAQKAGTSDLTSVLKRHRHTIAISQIEIHYFDNCIMPAARSDQQQVQTTSAALERHLESSNASGTHYSITFHW